MLFSTFFDNLVTEFQRLQYQPLQFVQMSLLVISQFVQCLFSVNVYRGDTENMAQNHDMLRNDCQLALD